MIFNMVLLSKLWKSENISTVQCFLASDAKLYIYLAYHNENNKYIRYVDFGN